MAIGIDIKGPANVRIVGGQISDTDIGIRSRNGELTAAGVAFDNVYQPYDVVGGSASVSGSRITNDPKIRGVPKGKSFVGYQGQNGPPIPAQCPRCGSVFPSRNYSFGQSLFWSRDNDESCFNCHFEHAKVADGLFQIARDTIEVLIGSNFTKEQIIAVNQLSIQYISGETQWDNYLQLINDISPQLRNVLSIAKKYNTTACAWLSLFVAVTALWHDYNQNIQNPNARVEQLLGQSLEYLKDKRFFPDPPNQISESPKEKPADALPPKKDSKTATDTEHTKPKKAIKSREQKRIDKLKHRLMFKPVPRKPNISD